LITSEVDMQLSPSPVETITGVSRALRAGECTCAAVVERCLAQVDAWEPRVKAWVRVDRDGSLAQARERDRELAEGKCRGPLHGIPVGIKDLFDVAGWPTLAGAPWLSPAAAADDCPVVARLRAQGAIILGTTVTTQFACFDPPLTLNPWNLAVATGMCLGAIGSQTGGSITRPASFCGVSGCKPTFGLVPLAGVFPLAPSMDHAGPIARTVEDLAVLLEAIARKSIAGAPRDEPPRLGRLRGLFADRAEPASLRLFEEALDHLARRGATVCDVELPGSFDDVLDCHRVIITCEAASQHQQIFAAHKENYLPSIRGLIEDGLRVPVERYNRARQNKTSLLREVVAAMEDVDVLICPATVGPAPTPETTGDPSFNAPWSYTGQPTVSFPIGLSPDGLPLSFQLVGRLNDETALFTVAAWCESVIQEFGQKNTA
jgi:aspartyl-tRNA(Asn)/glutamyl-tRNA(Gln) amidotransferase subunit A